MLFRSNPAWEFGLRDLGVIEKGRQGDLLVLGAPTIEEYFSQVGKQGIHRMIKSGIQFYPEILRC